MKAVHITVPYKNIPFLAGSLTKVKDFVLLYTNWVEIFHLETASVITYRRKTSLSP